MFDVDRIREQFPILKRQVYGRPLVYLDSGATAQKPLQVIAAESRFYEQHNANVHRGVHRLSDEATNLYEQARATVAAFIGAARPEEIVFTSGATMSLNLVARTCGVGPGDNVVISAMEHHSNIVPWQQTGAEIRVIPVSDEGELLFDDRLIDSKTKVVAITQASNTLGTRPALQPILAKARAVGAITVVDGCQGVVHGGVNVAELGCDFYAFSGHKLFGPTGIGVLYGRYELLETFPPFLGGGDMVASVSFERTTYADPPLKFEAGTANFVGAIVLAEAIRWLSGLDAAAVEAHERRLLQQITTGLKTLKNVQIYGTAADKCPIVSFNLKGASPLDVGMILDKQGVAIRTGHHCAEPLMRRFRTEGMCRASLALYNTEEEIETFLKSVARAAEMLC